MANDNPDWTGVSVSTEEPIAGSPFSFSLDGQNHTTSNVAVPRGAQWLVIGVGTSSNITTVIVNGATTGIAYASPIGVGSESLLYVRVHPSLDTAINITIGTASGSGSVSVSMSFGFGPTLLEIDRKIPSPVFIIDSALSIIDSDSSPTGSKRLGTSLANSLAPPWMQPLAAIVSLASALAGNGTVTLVAGTAGQKIYVHDVYYQSTGATTLLLQDAAGNRLAGGVAFAANTTAIPPNDCKGRPCATGQALQIVNQTATATTLTGHTGYVKS